MSAQSSSTNDTFKCNMCRAMGSSTQLCETCNEYFCSICAKDHDHQDKKQEHMYTGLTQDTPVEHKSCQQCDDVCKIASNYCTQCSEFLCNNCTGIHRKVTATKSHELLTAEYMIEKNTVYCNLCKESVKKTRSTKYCKDCDEAFCDKCAKIHGQIKVTRSHILDSIDSITYNAPKTDRKMCEQCILDDLQNCASMFCEACNEYLCDACTQLHSKVKATKEHKLITLEMSKKGASENAKEQLCQACKGSENKRACMYCIDCEEYFCENCSMSHANMKVSKLHSQVTISSIPLKPKSSRICGTCSSLNNQEVDAFKYCSNCEEFICVSCTARHKIQKVTKDHVLVEPHSAVIETYTTSCFECKSIGKQSFAIFFCQTCKEYLCEQCTLMHKSQKWTKSHSISDISQKTVTVVKNCSCCESDKVIVAAVKYCPSCEECYCENCCLMHRRSKALKDHELVDVEQCLENRKNCTLCNKLQKTMLAEVLCQECDEYLCKGCLTFHKISKSSKHHQLLSVTDIMKVKEPLCEPCRCLDKSELATVFCQDCVPYEPMCDKCAEQHLVQKLSRTHKLSKDMAALITSYAEVGLQKTTESPVKQYVTEDTLSKTLHETTDTENFARKTQQKCAEKEEISKNSLPVQPNSKLAHDKMGIPGKPIASNIQSDSVQLSWDKPEQFVVGDYYQISYRDVGNKGKWKLYPGEYKESTVVLSDVTANSTYVFRVRVVYEEGESPYGSISDEVCTEPSPASRIVNFSKEMEKGNPSPSKYALPITELRNARNAIAKTKKFEVGAPPQKNISEKTIMLVGATGTGKSTLVDGIVNFVLGVNFADPYRFSVIDLEEDEKDRLHDQTLSQTEWITCYAINPEKGSRLTYRLNIIDTPGFGDTRGLKRDQEIVEQIRELFTHNGDKGVAFIDAVCFLIKAPDARLTAVQRYIFQSVMSLFGKDIEKNICSLITFADGQQPPVLAALKSSDLPFGKHFTFNNSGLFAKNVDLTEADLSPMFWSMGTKSFRAFCKHVVTMETKSLVMTKNVLDERVKLERTVQNLQPIVNNGLQKVQELKQEIAIFQSNEAVIRDNKNFSYEVDETRHKKTELPAGQHVTNCTHCNFTCHDKCIYANNDDKAKCSAMGAEGKCKICPEKCHWKTHANTPYIFEFEIKKVQKTYADMQKKYQEASGKLPTQKQIVQKMSEELDELLCDIDGLMYTVKSCNERLEEIALRPNPLTMVEHIDLMIEAETMEKKNGFIERIAVLNEFKQKAEITLRVENFNKEAEGTLSGVCENKKRSKKDLATILRSVGRYFRLTR